MTVPHPRDDLAARRAAKRDPEAAILAEYAAEKARNPTLVNAAEMVNDRCAELRPLGPQIVELLVAVCAHVDNCEPRHDQTAFMLVLDAAAVLGVSHQQVAVFMALLRGSTGAHISTDFSFDSAEESI